MSTDPATINEAPDVDPRRGMGRDVMMTFGGRVALTGVILVSDVIIARLMGPEGKGAFALVLAMASLGALVLGLGLDRSVAVMSGRSEEQGRSAFANAAFWTLATGAIGVLAIIVLYGAPAGSGGTPGPLAAIMPDLTGPQLWLAALALPAEIAYGIGTVGLLGRQRVLSFNVIRFLRRGLLLALIVGFMLIGRLDLTALLLLNLAVMVVITIGIVWAMARADMVGWRPDAGLLPEQLSFGGRAFIGTIAERLHYRASTFLLTAFVSIAATGIFSVALGLAETMWYLPSSFGLVLFSRAVRPGVDSSAIASAMTRTVLALGIAAAIPLWFLAPSLVSLVYGSDFAEAGGALQIMLPGVVAFSIVAVLSHFIIAAGAPGKVATVAMVGLAINLVACLVLIPTFAMTGAATAHLISYTATAVMTLFLFRRVSGRGLMETLIPRRSDLEATLADIRAALARRERRFT